MQDNEGFYYPQVDEEKCIHCKLCEKVCMYAMKQTYVTPLEKVYAYINGDKHVLRKSSSGGAFAALTSQFIDDSGVVFGAAFDSNWNVRHISIYEKEKLNLLQGSKYVQSHVGDTYKQTEGYLKAGRKVLYSGTPCQIKGLKCYLGKDYDNLLTVDFVCHGVPSPGIWRLYLDELVKSSNNIKRINQIKDIIFRDKTVSWEKFRFVIKVNLGKNDDFDLWAGIFNKNPFMKGFLCNVYLRPSCYSCPVKNGRSGSDIQMADFWGIKEVCKTLYHKDGVSMLIAQSEKGDALCRSLKGYLLPQINDITLLNQSYSKSSVPHSKRSQFFNRIEYEPFIPLINEITRDTLRDKLYCWARVILKSLGINYRLNKIVCKWRKKLQS